MLMNVDVLITGVKSGTFKDGNSYSFFTFLDEETGETMRVYSDNVSNLKIMEKNKIKLSLSKGSKGFFLNHVA